MLIRQGDLIMRRTGAHQATAPVVPVTLATGSGSDHAHVVLGVPAGAGVLDVPVDTTLQVAGQPWRHDALSVPAGRYAHWVQRELTEDEEQEEIRSVED